MGREREASGPFNFAAVVQQHGGFLPRVVLAHGHHPGATPGSRTHSSEAARQHAAESPKLSSLRAARRQPAIFIWGRGRQAMHLLCKQVDVGALPTGSTNFQLRETRPMHREKPHKLLQVGVTPTPATNYLRRATKGSDPAARL